MPILKRKNKAEVFTGKTPIFFNQESHKDDLYFEIKKKNYQHGTTIAERLDLSKTTDNWYGEAYFQRGLISNYGIIIDYKGVVAIALIDDNGGMKIFCRYYYFEDNPSHKKYINKFAKDNGLSLRKDIHYVPDGLINSWIKPFEVGLEFYSDEVQDSVSNGLKEELKSKYAPVEVVVESEPNVAISDINESTVFEL